uniref:disks large-associated protein 1-like n=1 Tax=Centroberyx gerrardi TaxID=166262 RepID=UPI003AAEA28C
MTMKGLSSSRSHHHTVTCDPSYDSMTLGHTDRRPYFLNPGDAHPADHPYYAQRNSFQSECGAYTDLASCTFPRRHYSSHHELKEECGAVVPYTGGPTGSSKGGGGGGGAGGNNNRIPPNLLEQFERQAPVRRDGYHTLQYKRTAVEHQRSDSPGRIRHLVHSVQKLFTKSHSLEGPSGSGGGGSGRMNGGKASPDDPPSCSGTLKHSKRGKSKDRSKSEPKMRSAISGYWSSDDTLDREMCLYHHQHGGSGGGPPSGVMTMGRRPDKSQSQYFMESYNTISAHSLKTSRSNNDVKCSTCSGGSSGGLPLVGGLDGQLQLKKSSWSSTLTVSRAREVYQKASVNLDKALVKAEQGRTCHFLQVPQDEWSGFSPLGKDDEIPCRRMRSGSYIKAMAEEDSGDSDCSPKPSPKVQARRASYLKATQPSLTEMTTLK